MNKPTYARARLWTGIVGVGITVVLCLAALIGGWPQALLGAEPRDLLAAVGPLVLLLTGIGLLLLPIELIGGWWLPRRFGREAPSLGAFAASWLRAQLVLTQLGVVQGLALLAAGRWGGAPAALLVVAAGALLLLAFQLPFARWITGLVAHRQRDPEGRTLQVLDTTDSAFSGGFTGLRGIPVVPRRWLEELDAPARDALLRRRDSVRSSGERGWALLVGLAWNLAGLGLASQLPGAGVTTLAELAATGAGFTLWTFLGLLLLPAPSRAATFAADGRTEAAGREDLARALRQLDAWQDDEPERSAGLESVFHPVPSLGSRLRRLAEPGATVGRRARGLWNLARASLVLAHLGLSPLPRLVHGCVGRPELWVYLPTDG